MKNTIVFFLKKNELHIATNLLYLLIEHIKSKKKFFNIYLNGEVGSGKTEFVRNFINKNFDQNIIIQSPTYKIYNEYKIKNQNIFHFDFYKYFYKKIILNNFIEIKKNSIVFIEWGYKKLNPNKYDIIINIKYYKNEIRKYDILFLT